MADARCLQVDVAADEVDLVSGLLWATGATAVEELDLGHGRARLVAGLASGVEAAMVARLSPRWRPDVFAAEHDGWLDAWRPFARPVRVGSIVVHPPWEPPPWPGLPGEAGDLVVAVDPGRAFGQGNHATTQLMLAVLAERTPVGGEVLDVGCGSGVLAVVAARFGARRVRAIDIEEEAVRATVENAERNGVGGVVRASTTPLAEVDGVADLVLANILAPVLVELAPALGAWVAPGGLLAVSGLLADQRDRVLAAFRGWSLVEERADDGWRALVLTPPA